jgi:ABC-type dipeptide/oligopeptide/nickel transport system permease component
MSLCRRIEAILKGQKAMQSTLGLSLLKRIGWGIVTMWGVSLITFTLLFIVPRLGKSSLVKATGKKLDPTTMMAMTIAGAHATPENIENIKADFGLDKPLYQQYFGFVGAALTNNLKSYRNNERVFSAIWRRFPATAWLAISGLSIWLIIAIPLGSLTAKYAGKWFDRLALVLGIVALSIPTFWLGRLLQYYAGYKWQLFSVGGGANWQNLPLPALTLGLGGAAYYSRLLHANMRGVLGQEYIRAARARGLSEALVLGKHGLKNALIPLITILGMDIASLLSGLIFTEKIFGWPGIGSLAVDSVTNLDVPMIMGTVLFSAFMVVVANIGVDLAYRLIDPRVRVD